MIEELKGFSVEDLLELREKAIDPLKYRASIPSDEEFLVQVKKNAVRQLEFEIIVKEAYEKGQK